MTNHFKAHDCWNACMAAFILAALCAVPASAAAQDTGKSSGQQPPVSVADEPVNVNAVVEPGRLMRAFSWAETQIENHLGARDGWYPELGGMIPGAGVSVGPGYRHHLFGDQAVLDASAAISWNGYRMMRSQLTWPSLMNDRLLIGGQVKYQDFTQINFFGIGNTTLKSDQTDYRLKDVDALGFVTVSPTSWLSVTGRAGALRRLSIEPGTSTIHPSIDEGFDQIAAPGLTRQPNYVHADVAMDVDTRDEPGYPSSGGRYSLSVAMFHDQDFSSYSFRRAGAEAEQYVPLGRTVLALRGRVGMSQSGAGQTVPFYMLPTLGGSNSLRGYLDYRFRDQDAMLMVAEYRWPIHRLIDAAVFYDTGSVAPAARALFDHLNPDYGGGIRVHSAKHLLLQLDVARGNEGTRALVTVMTPLGLRSSRTVAPYVP
jgi:Omp85 superfamily domain